jgi:hypothetical protein
MAGTLGTEGVMSAPKANRIDPYSPRAARGCMPQFARLVIPDASFESRAGTEWDTAINSRGAVNQRKREFDPEITGTLEGTPRNPQYCRRTGDPGERGRIDANLCGNSGKRETPGGWPSRRLLVTGGDDGVRFPTRVSPRRTQLEPGFVERGSLRIKRLRRSAVIEVIPWNGSSEPEPEVSATPKEPRDPLKLARHYQSLLDSGQFESRAALARHLGVSRARVTQVLKRLNANPMAGQPG